MDCRWRNVRGEKSGKLPPLYYSTPPSFGLDSMIEHLSHFSLPFSLSSSSSSTLVIINNNTIIGAVLLRHHPSIL